MPSITPLEPHIAALVEDIDIAAPIDDDTFAALRQAFATHSVLVFRGREITDAQQIAFSEGFGRLEPTMPGDPIGDGAPVGVFSNLDDSGEIIPPDDDRMRYQKGNELWHADGSFRPVPLRGSILSARAIPPEGGKTEYASTRAAYAALSDDMKELLETLTAEHSLAHSRAQIAPELVGDDFLKDTPPAIHPLVRSIPETGEKALLVGSFATRVVGWPIEKSRVLLRELLEGATQSQFVYRHEWQLHDLVMWDNFGCLHRAREFDRGRYRRVMHRTTLAGD